MQIRLWVNTISQFFKFILFITCCVVYATGSFADQGNGNNLTCSLSVINLNFGSFNPYDQTPETGLTTASVTCTTTGDFSTNVSYTVSFSAGNSGDETARIAKQGASLPLSYNIYANGGYTQILGDGLSNTYTLSKSYFLSKNDSQTDTFTIYGKIPVQALTNTGTYTDTLTVTLTY